MVLYYVYFTSLWVFLLASLISYLFNAISDLREIEIRVMSHGTVDIHISIGFYHFLSEMCDG